MSAIALPLCGAYVRRVTQDGILTVIVGVFLGNMVSFAVIYCLWIICRTQDETRIKPLVLFGFAMPMLLAAAVLATAG